MGFLVFCLVGFLLFWLGFFSWFGWVLVCWFFCVWVVVVFFVWVWIYVINGNGDTLINKIILNLKCNNSVVYKWKIVILVKL